MSGLSIVGSRPCAAAPTNKAGKIAGFVVPQLETAPELISAVLFEAACVVFEVRWHVAAVSPAISVKTDLGQIFELAIQKKGIVTATQLQLERACKVGYDTQSRSDRITAINWVVDVDEVVARTRFTRGVAKNFGSVEVDLIETTTSIERNVIPLAVDPDRVIAASCVDTNVDLSGHRQSTSEFDINLS